MHRDLVQSSLLIIVDLMGWNLMNSSEIFQTLELTYVVNIRRISWRLNTFLETNTK